MALFFARGAVALLMPERARPPGQAAKRFHALALALGALYLVIQPPLASRDELLHLLRALELSQGRLVTRTDVEGPFYEAPSAFARLLGAHQDLEGDRDARIDHEGFRSELTSREGMRDTTRVPALSQVRTPLGYVPYIPAMWLAHRLDLSALGYLYIARMFGLVACVLLIGRVIASFGELSWPWLVLGLSPAMLMQAAACSPEGIAASLSLLFAALIARVSLVPQGAPAKRECTALLVVFGLLVACRISYLPFGLAFFALPGEVQDPRWSSRNKLLLCAALVGLVASTVSICLSRDSLSFLLEKQAVPQLSWMMRHPFDALWAWLRTMFKQSDDFALGALVGSGVVPMQLRFVGGVVGTVLVQLLVLLSFGHFHSARHAEGPERRVARTFLALVAVYVVALFAVAQIGSNQHAQTPLHGLDGHLFLPLLPFLLLTLSTRGRPIATRWLLRGGGFRVLGTLSLVNLICAWALVGRYYAAIEPPWPY
jgi:uncharacterized membrane protein